MTLQILSDSETGRKSYKKEVDVFLENGLVGAKIPQGNPFSYAGENTNFMANNETSQITSSYTSSQQSSTITDDQEA